MFGVFPSHILIAITLSASGSAAGHSCYVCGGPDGNVGQLARIFPGTAAFPPCDVGRAVRRCPPEYQGCLTQNNGTRITKTCGHLAMNTCKTANKVEYCYCQGELCNGKDEVRPQSTRVSSEDQDYDEQEDEEEEDDEGSASMPGGRDAVDDFQTLVRPAYPTPTEAGTHSSSSTTTPSILSCAILFLLTFNHKVSRSVRM